ncbi:MAG: UvrD-helicase domain-containing protein, partial [Gemmatimonadaceae bacterium]|nr:UvrD-helicase domain-containing protein [Gemmatimonadaceae bacterium]
HGEGPALVLAGAGSGKTRVLTTRIARLIEGEGVHPARVLAVTFTNKAAGEMRERIARLIGEAPQGMWVGTFHAIGARMLRRDAERVGRTTRFTIYDEDDALGLLKRTMESLRVSPKEWAPKAVLAQISDAKNALVGHAEYARLAQDPLAAVVAKLYPAFDAALAQANAVTFDDLLVLPVRLLSEHPDVLQAYRDRFAYLLVDEYQDTNHAQFKLVALLGGGTGNVMVVGDDDQSIYGWRGADIRNILEFERGFPGATVVRLEENYRSTPEILALANAAIAGNTQRRGKTLRATRPGGAKPMRVRCLDERDEADWIAEEIATRRGARTTFRDVAILYRTNAQSRAFEEAFRRRGWPYRLVGAVRFYDRREIRDLMAYLKLVANPADDEAFRRAINVPKRGLGDTTVEALAEGAAARGIPLLEAARLPAVTEGLRPAARTALAGVVALLDELRTRAVDAAVDELLELIVSRIGYTEHLRAEGPEGVERIENVRELVTSAAEQLEDEEGEVGLTPLDRYLQRAMLVAGTDQLDPTADAITMMTLHNAKGLEYPVVYLTGLEDGLFPLARAYDDPAMLEEERRLFYVGITRAETVLVLSHAETRRRNGETMPARPSSFLDELPKELYDQQTTPAARSKGRQGWGGGAGTGSGWGQSSWDREERAARWQPRAAVPPIAVPTWSARPTAAVDESAGEAFQVAVGARVRHRKFGVGRIAEVLGSGRDMKVRIDFDDEEVGRKTLVVAQANLEPEHD